MPTVQRLSAIIQGQKNGVNDPTNQNHACVFGRRSRGLCYFKGKWSLANGRKG
ncbi:hypothetical protein ECA2092 [Pectobacterium atrosepticum SCRI1043]|uniref:Uncharacterized protein n=1 Tax=Pectobacterium atrosepticum (strain SCRI 1043 / ATCC BAA-672) TaxID=218491 RepID=Q6D5E8_PECAS|nr:hypothetical protein ECA2092 [Pectobacterium atrosepticum SCRI1043]